MRARPEPRPQNLWCPARGAKGLQAPLGSLRTLLTWESWGTRRGLMSDSGWQRTGPMAVLGGSELGSTRPGLAHTWSQSPWF